MTIFAHHERAVNPLLAPALGRARPARADGVWVRDARGSPVLAREPRGSAVGLLLDVPDALGEALDMLWGGPGVSRCEQRVTASLRREPAVAWCLESLRLAKMHGYRLPRGVTP